MPRRSNDFLQEVPSPPDKKEELKALVTLIESSKTDSVELLKALVDAIKSLQPQNISIPEPNINISMDVERIIKAMPTMPEQKAPIVNMDMDGLKGLANKEPRKPESYEFDIKRDGHGRISKVIANPIGVGL